MNDAEITARIDELVEEEHRLEQAHTDGGVSPEDQERLSKVEVALDQCWDLLRQRRARRNAGLNPDEAEVRDPSTVERYQQ